jgi:uncharacterized membrane protein YfcA
VSTADYVGLLVAGVAGGLFGSIAGLASLASYPALLLIGLSPLTANVTNTVALVLGSTGSIIGSTPELSRRRASTRPLIACGLAGGAIGGCILLLTPASTFTKVVPFLVALSSVAVLLRRRIIEEAESDAPIHNRRILLMVVVISMYAGYFGAGAGVMMLAALLLWTADTLPHCSAIRNLVLGFANLVAAVAFVVFADVQWTAAVPLGIGLFVGGWIGPAVVRRTNPLLLTRLIACGGLLLAVKLALDAY